MTKLKLLLHTTSVCNLNCTECGQKSWRDKPYHMSEQEIDDLLQALKDSKYGVKQCILSGGEPILWKNLHLVVRLRKSSNIHAITLFSNGVTKIPEWLIETVDKVQFSLYPKSDVEYIKGLQGRYAHIAVKNKHKFWKWPRKKMEGMIPALCGCAIVSYFDGYIANCGQVFEIEKRFNVDCSRLKTKICKDFLKHLAPETYGHHDICSYCIENFNVQKVINKIKND